MSPVYGPYSYGWAMTIGNYRGWTGEGIKTEGRKRSVQLIIEVWDSQSGLDAILVRDVVPREIQPGPDILPETHPDKEHAVDAPKPRVSPNLACCSRPGTIRAAKEAFTIGLGVTDTGFV